jgi:hypothetical protein
MQEILQKPFPFLPLCGIICMQTKTFAGNLLTGKRREQRMALLIFLALMFVLLLIDDHSRQMQLEQGLADYMHIEYHHAYPTSD